MKNSIFFFLLTFLTSTVQAQKKVDKIAPTIKSINRQVPTSEIITISEVTYRVTFSELVTGADVGDFSATVVSGSLTATVSSITMVGATGSTYDVTVTSITGSGVLRLDLKASGTGIKDAAGNAISGGYTSGQTYSVNPPPPNTDPLVGNWKMEEGSGTVLVDSSTHQNNGSIIGSPVWVSGKVGKALDLDGRSAYATVPNNASLNPSAAITLAAWIRPEKVATQYVIKKANLNASDGYELSLSNAGKVFFRINQATSADDFRVNSLASYPADGATWMHVAATYDGTAMKLYINGVENAVHTLTSAPVISTNTLALAIGAQSNGSSLFKGAIDEVYIYNEVLSASEIAQLAQVDILPSTDATAPSVVSVNRQVPLTQSTTASSVTFRATFSEKVRGVDKTDFTAQVVSGSLQPLVGTVTAVGSDSSAYDITVTGLSGSGELRLDVKASGMAIVDTAGNALPGGYTSGQSYLVNPPQGGFLTVTQLNPLSVAHSTGYKPQAKVWMYAGKHWAVLADGTGTYLWRLNGITWTSVLKLSGRTTTKADCRVVGNITHVLLFQGPSSQFVSLEYVPSLNTYQLWSRRTSTVGLTLDDGVETATIDMDGTGRIWLASDGINQVNLRWSDAPYSTWSDPITMDSTITDDDISAVIYMPTAKKIGVFWSNQNTRYFGFKTHADGASPTTWSADERPASQSATNNVGGGMADDHMNLSITSNGTMYCAVKTSYNTSGYPQLSLLIRRPTGAWDNLYEISETGTRPIALLNEEKGKLRIVYSSEEQGGDILYRETSLTSIAFSSASVLIKGGSYDNSTSTHQNLRSEVAILASDDNIAAGVVASDGPSSLAPEVPTLDLPATGSDVNTGNVTLSWNATVESVSYQVQVATSATFSSIVFDNSGIEATSVPVPGLTLGKLYYWRVKASNAAGNSNWSVVWNFETVPATLVGHWKMEEGSGTILMDATPYKNHGSIIGTPTWVSGKVGKALDLDGSSEYASVPNNASLNPSAAITLAAWIRPEKVATQYVIKKANLNASDGYELSLSNAGKVFFRINQATSADDFRVNSLASYPTDGATWMHVAATYDGTAMKLYINGVENASFVLGSSVAINPNSLALAIGAQSSGFSKFQGALDDARVYNTALSASEIAGLAGVSSVQATITTQVDVVPATLLQTAEFIAYPNPFPSRTTLRITLPESGRYSIGLYDLKGQLISLLEKGEATAGTHRLVDLDGSRLAKGLYIVRLHSGRNSKNLKVVKGN